MKKYFLFIMFTVGSISIFTSCNNDELDPNSIFVDPEYEIADPNSYSYKFDKWLYYNYLLPYNLQFRYRLEDVGSDMDYNVIPTDYNKAIDMAVLIKYLWFDVYAVRVSEDFLREYGPRIIHLIGSAEFNPANGTMVLGVAEGGLKVTLTQCNKLDVNNFEFVNEHFFKTMHHEFSHILHQTKTYPKDFKLFSAGLYEPFSWQDRTDAEAAALGFVSPYAGSQQQEDFVEVIANYIVKTDKQWENILKMADAGNKRGVILSKLDMCKTWLHDSWEIELDSLRKEVQDRQAVVALKMDSLRNQINTEYSDEKSDESSD